MPLLKFSYREITKVGKIVRRVHYFYYEREETTTTLSCYITKFGISDKKRPKMGLFFSYMPKRDLKLLVSPLSIRGMSL